MVGLEFPGDIINVDGYKSGLVEILSQKPHQGVLVETVSLDVEPQSVFPT